MNELNGRIELLIVEDNPGDARLLREGIKGWSSPPQAVHEVRDGVEALEFLKGRGLPGGPPLPNLILLDLNLPRMSGHEVLAQVKNDPRLRRIPIIVLTSSEADSDICRSYDLHANCCLVKPPTLDGFYEVVGAIEAFWVRMAMLPGRKRGCHG